MLVYALRRDCANTNLTVPACPGYFRLKLKRSIRKAVFKVTMFTEAINIFYGLMGGLAIVIVYFLIASVFWHQDSSKQFEGKPVHAELAHQLTDLHVSKKKMQEAVERMAEVVQREVTKETQKIQAETHKIIAEKEEKVKEITNKYKIAEQHYQVLGKQKTQTESVVRSIAGGVIVLDDSEKVVFLNPDAEKNSRS